MDSEELQTLSRRGLALARFSTEAWEVAENTRLGGARFSLTFPHEIARRGRSQSLALIATLGDKPGFRVGLIRSVAASSTFDSRVVFDLVRPIRPGSLTALLVSVTDGPLRGQAASLERDREPFRALSPKLSERLIESIGADPCNTIVLQRIVSQLERPKLFGNARALQQDAVGLALRAFGGMEGATSITLSDGDTALAAVRLQEDAVIEHDARWIPGWRLVDSDLTGRAMFARHDAQLEVFTANSRPLEELFGVDLIYLNHPRGALVMVQYKMMEPDERNRRHIEREGLTDGEDRDQEWHVRIDTQFRSELARMAKFDSDLSPDGPYRLNNSAFFFKLVKRHAATTTSGIILSFGHLNKLIAEGASTGPKGGLRVSYKTLDGHYLRSSSFVDLVQSGYIGTRGATTEHFQNLIDAALKGGRAVVAAMQSARERPEGARR